MRRLQENYADAEKFAREAWVLATKVHGEQDATTLEHQCNAGYGVYLAGRYARDAYVRLPPAEQLMRAALEQLTEHWPDHRFEINTCKVRLANLLVHRGDLPEAEQILRNVIAERRDTLGEDSKYLVSDLLKMAEIHSAKNDLFKAEKVAREALAMVERVNDERERIRGLVYYRLSAVVEHDRPEEAVEWHGKAIDAWHSCLGNHLTVAVQRRRLAEQLRSLGRFTEAERALKQSFEVLSYYPERPQAHGITHQRIADLLRAAGEPKRAVEHLSKAIAIHDPASIYSTVARIDYIETLIEIGARDEAEKASNDWLAVADQAKHKAFKIIPRISKAQLEIARDDYKTANERLHRLLTQLGPYRRLKARTEGILAKCQIKQGDFESAEQLLLVQHKDEAIALSPLEPRRIARQFVELYVSWDKPDKANQWREVRHLDESREP